MRARDRRVLRRRFVEPQAEEAAQGEEIGRPPGDAALRIDAFEVPDQQEAEVRARCQTRPTNPVRVERDALALDELVGDVRVKHLISSAGRTGGRAECSTADLVSVPLLSPRAARSVSEYSKSPQYIVVIGRYEY